MITLLRDHLVMSDELPSGDKAVYVFIEMVALGFVLYAIEEAFKDNPSWIKVILALVLGLAFFLLGINWPTLRARLWPTLVSRIEAVANDYRYRYGLGLLLVGVTAVYASIYVHSLRSDLDTYVMPRTLTPKQVKDFRNYLNAHDPHSVTVKFLDGDSEARDYAFQFFLAIRETNWEVSNGAIPADAKSEGMGDGVNLFEEEVGQPTDRDPKIPRPYEIMQAAFREANIQLNGGGGGANRPTSSLSIVIGRRPVAITTTPSFRQRIGQWILGHFVFPR